MWIDDDFYPHFYRITMKKNKIILVNPNNKGNYVQGKFLRENLGLGYLASYLRYAGFDVEIIDSRIENHSPESATAEIIKNNPFLVGFSIIAKDAIEWCEKVGDSLKKKTKDSLLHISLGNYFPTLQPKRALESMPSADSVILGEGELTLTGLVKGLYSEKNWSRMTGIAHRTKNKIVIGKRRELIKKLDELPFPEHYASKYHLTEFAIEGSRGCYCACSFCSISPFVQAKSVTEKWRFRSAKNIVDEIENTIQKTSDIKVFRFVDPDFVGSPEHTNRLKDFIQELKNRNIVIDFIIDTRPDNVINVPLKIWQDLRDVGLKEVYLGVESASPFIKKMMFKRSTIEEDTKAISILNDLGIKTRFGFMMITPWTKEEDIIPNALILRSLGFARLDKFFQEMYLVPGTSAIELVKKTSKIWFNNQGKGEYYTYELPYPINNLRKISGFITNNCLDFLERIESLHENILKREASLDNDLEKFKNRLSDFNLDLFLKVFKESKNIPANTSDEIVKCLAENIVDSYKMKLNQIENDFNSLVI